MKPSSDMPLGNAIQIFRVEPEDTVNVQSRKNMKTMAETYQRYLLWKAEVDKAAWFGKSTDPRANP